MFGRLLKVVVGTSVCLLFCGADSCPSDEELKKRVDEAWQSCLKSSGVVGGLSEYRPCIGYSELGKDWEGTGRRLVCPQTGQPLYEGPRSVGVIGTFNAGVLGRVFGSKFIQVGGAAELDVVCVAESLSLSHNHVGVDGSLKDPRAFVRAVALVIAAVDVRAGAGASVIKDLDVVSVSGGASMIVGRRQPYCLRGDHREGEKIGCKDGELDTAWSEGLQEFVKKKNSVPRRDGAPSLSVPRSEDAPRPN